MTNTKFKSTITMAATATVYSDELTFNFPSGKNAYRLNSLKFQITDFDAEADDDYIKIQFNYEDKAGGAMDTIEDKDEILTWSKRVHDNSSGTDAGTDLIAEVENFDKLRDSGILLLDGKDFDDIFIVNTKAFLNVISGGQDASEVFRYIMSGQYVKLPDAVIDSIKRGVSLT